MPPAGFEPAFPASKQPQTHALERAANGNGHFKYILRAKNTSAKSGRKVALTLQPEEANLKLHEIQKNLCVFKVTECYTARCYQARGEELQN